MHEGTREHLTSRVRPFAASSSSRQCPDVKRRAAVLVLLEWLDGDWHVLLTVRSAHLRTHAGEVCLPGGMEDEEDVSIVDTALREAEEEVGIDRRKVAVIGCLPPLRTRLDIALHPVVAIALSHQVPTPNVEVERAFTLPLSRFLDDAGHSLPRIGNFTTHAFMDVLDDGDVTTWGITSFVCIIIAMIVYQRSPAFTFPLQAHIQAREGDKYVCYFEIRSTGSLISRSIGGNSYLCKVHSYHQWVA